MHRMTVCSDCPQRSASIAKGRSTSGSPGRVPRRASGRGQRARSRALLRRRDGSSSLCSHQQDRSPGRYGTPRAGAREMSGHLVCDDTSASNRPSAASLWRWRRTTCSSRSRADSCRLTRHALVHHLRHLIEPIDRHGERRKRAGTDAPRREHGADATDRATSCQQPSGARRSCPQDTPRAGRSRRMAVWSAAGRAGRH